MDEERKRRLSEWYGTPLGADPVGQTEETEGAAPLSTQIPPRCSPGSSPDDGQPHWGEETVPRRKKHIGARIAGICALVVVIIAATALLFSNGDMTLPPINTGNGGMDAYDDYRDYFAGYYDNAGESGQWTSSMPRAETGTGVTVALTPRPEGDALSLSEVYDRCASSVVAITSSTEDGRYLWGTGIIMTADGYILTNAHVLEGSSEATVTLWDDREFTASLVGADSASDVAVIKINAVGLPVAEFCEDSVSVGESVAAIGNPLGPELRGTMTDGIISALSREITYTSHPMTLIQTNVAINEGNSGGPLLNMYGQVVGMTSMKLVSAYAGSSIDGIGFAIPVSTIKAMADALIAYGEVRGRPALGITVGTIPAEVAEYYDIPAGLYVNGVTEGSDAEAQGVTVGDIIVSADGQHVSELADLSAILADKEVGDSVSLEIYRYGGEMAYVDVRLMETVDLY